MLEQGHLFKKVLCSPPHKNDNKVKKSQKKTKVLLKLKGDKRK